jgi:hypothetical protein
LFEDLSGLHNELLRFNEFSPCLAAQDLVRSRFTDSILGSRHGLLVDLLPVYLGLVPVPGRLLPVIGGGGAVTGSGGTVVGRGGTVAGGGVAIGSRLVYQLPDLGEQGLRMREIGTGLAPFLLSVRAKPTQSFGAKLPVEERIERGAFECVNPLG